MKLATFSTAANSIQRIGVVTPAGVIDACTHLSDVPEHMLELISRWDTFGERLAAVTADNVIALPLHQVRLHAPIGRPGKISAIGLNYADHIEESKLERPKHQLWFAKAITSIHDPFEPIQVPKLSEQVDYEAELVAVIGKRCRHLSKKEAADAVFGYCVGNDISVRDWQMQTPQWYLGKSFDTHAPYGPWIVTADEVGDPHTLDIRCLVNGELRQHSNTRNLVFNVFEQVAYLSEVMTLEPGDLVFTGTPGGVGWARSPQVWLQAGDKVRVEIERLGSIEAVMRRE